MITIAARCQNDADVKKYFNRPDFRECIALAAPGLKVCNGVIKEIIPGQRIMEDFEAEDELEFYYGDKEARLFICKRFPRRCQ
jgi:hypothetical protein